MPPFAGKELALRSYCSCCLAPIDLTARDGVVQAPEGVLVHISTSPWDWNNDDIVHQCDSMNFVLDAAHADRYRSEEHTSELQSLMRISYAVFCLKKKITTITHNTPSITKMITS